MRFESLLVLILFKFKKLPNISEIRVVHKVLREGGTKVIILFKPFVTVTKALAWLAPNLLSPKDFFSPFLSTKFWLHGF